jgi:ribosomal protein L40E
MFAICFAAFLYHFLTLYSSRAIVVDPSVQGTIPSLRRWARVRSMIGVALLAIGAAWLIFFNRVIVNDLYATPGIVFAAAGLHMAYSKLCPQCGVINENSATQCKTCGAPIAEADEA